MHSFVSISDDKFVPTSGSAKIFGQRKGNLSTSRDWAVKKLIIKKGKNSNKNGKVSAHLHAPGMLHGWGGSASIDGNDMAFSGAEYTFGIFNDIGVGSYTKRVFSFRSKTDKERQ